MTKISAAEKAEKLIQDGSIFLFGNTEKLEYWICRGSRGNKYTITFNKERNTYNCDCKNIRMIDCSHILGVKQLKK